MTGNAFVGRQRSSSVPPCARCGQPSIGAIWDVPVCAICQGDWHSRPEHTAASVQAAIGARGVVGEKFEDLLVEFRRRTRAWAKGGKR